MAIYGQMKPGQARVHQAQDGGSQGDKEYVPVNAEHAAAIAAGNASAGDGVVEPRFFGSDRVRVRFNCTYDVMDASGKVTQVRAGHERVFKKDDEGMADRACEGIRYRNASWEQEVISMGSGGPRKLYPTFLGWGTFSASKLKPELPKSFGVRVGGKP